MTNVAVSATATTTVTAPASLTVARPRIKRISISGYRAFPPYRPTSFEVNLGNDGKNLLLYGENGSGKTSLFRALRDLFSVSAGTMIYNDRRNAFAQENDDSVVVELTSGAPAEYRWETGEDHPKESGGTQFREFASSCLFLDYRDLLETNFVHRQGSPDLFHLLVKTILRDLPVPSRRLFDVYQSMLWSNPRRRTVRQVGIARARAEALTEALTNHLPEVVTEGNRILQKLQSGVQFSLQPGTVEYVYDDRSFSGQIIPLKVTYNGLDVTEPQYFLNEARLTALGLSIYLAGARIIRSGRPGILVLDDVLMGLDLENRIPLLRLLVEEFVEWQVLLLTHDQFWYELAREYTSNLVMWTPKELYLVDGPALSPPIPEIRGGCDLVDRANGSISRNEFNPAANYLRIAFENKLKKVCEENKIELPFKRQIRNVTADALWKGVCERQKRRQELQGREPAKGHPDFISQILIRRVNMIRSNVLNGLSHDGSNNIKKAEVEAARDTIRDLCSHTFPAKKS